MKLYHAPHSRSTRPLWLLEELGAPCEVHRLDVAAKEHKSEAYLRIHPLGQVPALVDEEGPLFESIALCMHLADRYPEKGLAPAPGTHQRGLYYQWMLFGATNLDQTLTEIYAHQRFHPDDPAWAARAEAARGRLPQQLAVCDRALDRREYLLGGFSAADVVIGSLLLLGERMGVLDGYPNLGGYVARLKARPACQRALAD